MEPGSHERRVGLQPLMCSKVTQYQLTSAPHVHQPYRYGSPQRCSSRLAVKIRPPFLIRYTVDSLTMVAVRIAPCCSRMQLFAPTRPCTKGLLYLFDSTPYQRWERRQGIFERCILGRTWDRLEARQAPTRSQKQIYIRSSIYFYCVMFEPIMFSPEG